MHDYTCQIIAKSSSSAQWNYANAVCNDKPNRDDNNNATAKSNNDLNMQQWSKNIDYNEKHDNFNSEVVNIMM